MKYIDRLRAWTGRRNTQSSLKDAYREHRKVFPKATNHECAVALGRAKSLGLTPKQWAEKAKKYQT